MGFQDALCIFTTPIHAVYKTGLITSSYAWNTTKTATNYLGLLLKSEAKRPDPVPIWKLAASSGPYVKLAALSGCIAVLLGSYGTNKCETGEYEQEQRRILEVANRYHFIHTLALLGVPLCRNPFLVSTLILSGILLFCGSRYYAVFNNKTVLANDKLLKNTISDIGKYCFILGWCSMIF